MNNLSKFLMLFIAIFATYSCTDLEENLVGDVTTEINIDGIDQGGGTGSSGPLSAAYASHAYTRILEWYLGANVWSD